MKLINRNNLAVRFATAKEKSRYTLRAVLATESETVATDGHILARVSLPVQDSTPNGFTRGLIPADVCKEIEQSIPKSKNLPITLAAITTEHVEDRDILKIATTDLETPKVFTVRQPDGQFPNWDSIWPTDEPVMDICFNASQIADLAQAAAKFSDRAAKTIRLRFYSPYSAMRFDLVNDDGQEMNGLLMPVRPGSVNPTFKPDRYDSR